MKKIFFTVGPSQLYPTVSNHIKSALQDNIPSISHRGHLFMDIFQTTVNNLRQLLNIPASYHVFFLSSSLESMERIIENCVEEQSFHFVNGAFSKKFYHIALDLKKSPKKYEVSSGGIFYLEKVQVPKNTELICTTQNETSTGAAIPIQWINRLRKIYPKPLIVVDIVSSAPYVKLDFDKIDIAFFSGQKGFGLPAGMGVLIVNEKAIEKAKWLVKKNVNIGSYHNFLSLLKYSYNRQAPETPNVLDIYLLGLVTKDVLKKGIDQIRKETNVKADMIYKYLDQCQTFKPFVKNNQWQSRTTITIEVDYSKLIIEKLKSKGLIVGSGYGEFKDQHLRIANFPAHSIKDFKRLINNFP